MTSRPRSLGALVGTLLALTLVAGCGPTMADLPLPGSGVAGDTVEIIVRFDEALNLAQGAKVKINGVDSGRVRDVTAQDFRAVAVLEVRTSAKMRRTASARLRYTTPLGELFVDVSNPPRGPLLEDGDELAPANASTAPTVEDALASASLLINGGGLAQLQVVADELNDAIGGREDRVRRLLDHSQQFLSSADATTDEFLAALDSLARLSRILKDNEKTIDAALRDIRPAARVLRQNTPALTGLLDEVDRFADTANRVVGATRADLLRMLEQVSPVLDEFLANRALLGPSLRALVGVGAKLDEIVPGDYANLSLLLHLERVNLPVLGAPLDPDASDGSPHGGAGAGQGTPLDDLLGEDGALGGLGLDGLLGGGR